MTEGQVDGDAHHDARDGLRLWLRLLGTAGFVERELSARLRVMFNVSLARFDFMAQLDRAGPDGMTMGALSGKLMVTSGNVTGLTDRLQAEGLVERLADPSDRRVQRIAFTGKGRDLFRRMAAAHSDWVEDILADVPDEDRARLHDLLGDLKTSAQDAASRWSYAEAGE